MNCKIADVLNHTFGLLSRSIFLLFICCSASAPTDPDVDLTPADSLATLRAAFTEAEACQTCHPNHYDEWQSSMHAYSFVDPIFFKLNEIGQERSNQQLDQFCVKCHSPLASLLQETPPGFSPSSLSPLAKMGVQCDVCHTMASFEPGSSISDFRLDGVKQGPIQDPVATAFHGSAFDDRYERSEICSPCHDVFTTDGVQVEFTSTEWDQSPYTAMGLQCQGCHMPTYSGQAATGGPERTDLHRHTFVGVDIPLVDFPGRERTIAQVDDLLKNAVSMQVDTPNSINPNQDLLLQVTLTNDRTGHNVPSGTIFERQMWLEVLVTDAVSKEVVYSSGLLDENGDLLDHNSEFVKNGVEPADADLTLFNGTPLKNGNEIRFFWEADAVANRTIPPFDQRTAAYTVRGPFSAESLEVSVRLRFRSFPPYFLREIDEADLIENLIVFDMQEETLLISVNN